MSFLLVTSIAISDMAACRQSDNAATAAAAQVPESWRRFEAPPPLESPEVACSLRADARWRVFFDGHILGVARVNHIREREKIPYEIDFSDVIDPAIDRTWQLRYSREQAQRIVTGVSDGWLIGFNAGENGGSLWWYPLAPGRGAKLWDRNVLSIVQGPDANSAIVLSGLAHMSSDEGAALWIGRGQGGNWEISNRVKLRGAPHAHTVHPRGIAIGHANGIDLVSWNQTIESLVSVSHWMSSPFSAAVGPQGEIAVGRALFVSLFRPNKNGYSEEIYLPAQCATFRDNGLLCSCEGGGEPPS